MNHAIAVAITYCWLPVSFRHKQDWYGEGYCNFHQEPPVVSRGPRFAPLLLLRLPLQVARCALRLLLVGTTPLPL